MTVAKKYKNDDGWSLPLLTLVGSICKETCFPFGSRSTLNVSQLFPNCLETVVKHVKTNWETLDKR